MEEKVFKMEGFQSWWLSWSGPGPTWKPNPDHSEITAKTKILSFLRLFLPAYTPLRNPPSLKPGTVQ